MKVPLEVLIDDRERERRSRAPQERPFIEAPRPMRREYDEPSRKSETEIQIGYEEEEEDSERGVVIISIWEE